MLCVGALKAMRGGLVLLDESSLPWQCEDQAQKVWVGTLA